MTLWKLQMWTEQPWEEYQPEGIKKLCALIDAELVLPAHLVTYDCLTIGGLILNINSDYSLHHIASERTGAYTLSLARPVHINSVHTAARGLPLGVEIGSVLGSVYVETCTNRMLKVLGKA
ncbi:hypothetical protein BGZ92_009110 [Podila epicladia]|nr:hypothetical protein BGZ92_009110 [Podila epicladia]